MINMKKSFRNYITIKPLQTNQITSNFLASVKTTKNSKFNVLCLFFVFFPAIEMKFPGKEKALKDFTGAVKSA